MRNTLTHALLLVALLLALTLAADTATAAELGRQVDCFMSPGGAIEICI